MTTTEGKTKTENLTKNYKTEIKILAWVTLIRL